MNAKPLKVQLQEVWQSILRLRVVLFLTLVIGLCGFIGWRITTLTNAEPNAAAVDSTTNKMTVPNVDEAVVDKIKQLEDSNANAQALFDEARKNPFRE